MVNHMQGLHEQSLLALMLHSTTEALMHNSPQIRPQTPSSASISRMRWPFPMPPNEGLQDISPAQDHDRKTKTGLLYI